MIRLKLSLFILCLSSFLSLGYALDSDQHQQLSIATETADLNTQTGVDVYTGHVSMTQGTTHIKGETVTAYRQGDKITQVIIKGNQKTQASYESTIDINKPPLIATADTIKFFPDKNYAILLGHAHVQQGENSITGEHLEYDVTNKILKSLSVAGEKPVRTQIVIDPNNLPKMDQKSS